MQKILNEQKVRLINLAESIAAKGLKSMDRFLVIRSERQGKFIVVEGNRRLLAMKLLKNPSLIADLDIPDAFRKRLQRAAQTFDIKKVQPIDCFEVDGRGAANDWIRQRHNGADEGRGIVDWSNIASTRFVGRNPALQALDFVLEHADLTEEQRELIAGKFPLTTLDRLLSTPSVRTAIGFQIEKNKLLTKLPPPEAIKPLKRIVVDLAEKIVNVTQLKSKEQQNAYIAKFKASELPDLSQATKVATSVESMSDKDFAAQHAPAAKRARVSRSTPRTTVVPRSYRLNIKVPKIAGIFEELKSLQLAKHRHAISVLLRVFLEMSVDEYLTTVAKLALTFTKNGHTHDKKLATKVNETVNDLVQKKAGQAKDFLGVTKGVADPNHPFSIDTLHAYIHNRHFSPTDTRLATAWDNAQFFFEKIWN
jgi:hypothetical protein